MLPPPAPVSTGVVQTIYGESAEEREKLLRVLRDSIYPSQREWAADQLSEYDWKQNASVVDALVAAAKDDPAATVRAGCVRNLTRMHVNTVPVVVAIQSLKADADPRVRTQVQEALGILASGLPMAVEPAPLPESVKPQ